ncbi:MAG: hypothetical protein FJ356_02065 [Thaumarchaeota archaeon]|nr:hypothetical protein [Nitrososphaerota archaeon]
MAKIRITPRLTGTLAEAYFKEYCDQRGWAYLSLEQIHENGIKNGKLKFKKGFKRILVQLPEEIIKEIESISKPSNSSTLNPTFVYDFLTCKVGLGRKEDEILQMKNKNDFSWVEVKTSNVGLTRNQVQTLKKITIPLYRFRVPNPLLKANEVYIYGDEVNSDYLRNHQLDS